MYGRNRYGTTRYGSSGEVGAIQKFLSAAVDATATITRLPLKFLLGNVDVTATVRRLIPKSLIALADVTATVVRAAIMAKALTALVDVTATVTRAITYVKALAALADVTATVVRASTFVKALTAAASVASTIARVVLDIPYVMNQTLRRIYGRVRITYTDPYFSSGVEAEATETGRFTYPSQTTDNVEESAFKWFSLHENVLDGTYHPLPGDQSISVGWWNATLSAAGTGSFGSPPVLTITSSPRVVESLQVIGDDQLGEYPVDFTVRLYNESDVLLHTEPVTGNALVNWSTAITPVDAVAKQTLTISKWNEPEHVAKIVQFFTDLEITYEGEDLFGFRVLEEREFEGATIPTGNVSSREINVRLNNIDYDFSAGNTSSPLFGLLKNNRAIRAWLGADLPSGVRKWFPLGLFYSRDWNAPANETFAEVRGLDQLDRLRNSEFTTSEVYTDESLEDLAITVLTDAGLTAADWDIDAALGSIVIPYAWFDRMTHREAIRRIAAAALGQAYTDGDGVLVIEQYAPPADVSFTYDLSNTFEVNNPLAWSQMINFVQARAAPRLPGAVEDLVSDTEAFDVPALGTVTKTHFFVFVPAVDVGVPVITGDVEVTVDSYTHYSWGSSVTYANSAGTVKEVTSVTISGKPLEVQGGRIVTSEDATSVAQNGLQELPEPISSEFWQDEDIAQTSADSILATFSDPRRDVTMAARGNIQQTLGERVAAPDFAAVGGSTGQFGITRQDWDWDGGLRVNITAQKIAGAPILYQKALAANVDTTGIVTPSNIFDKALVANVAATSTVDRLAQKMLLGLVDGTATVVRAGIEASFQALSGSGKLLYRPTPVGAVCTTQRVASAADSVTTSLTNDTVTGTKFFSGGKWDCDFDRLYVYFDLSALTGATITSATLQLYVNSRDTSSVQVRIFDGQSNGVPSEAGGSPNLVVGDFITSDYSQIVVSSTPVPVAQYVSFTIPNGSITVGGLTKLCVQCNECGGSSGTAHSAAIDMSEGPNPPLLELVYSIGG